MRTVTHCTAMNPLALLTIAGLPLVQAGGGANVFALGDYVVDHPWGTFLTTVFIILLYISIEHGDHRMQHIGNQFLRRVLSHIVQEVKNFGILSLILFFCVNFVTNSYLILVLDWAHMVLFMMACMFIMGISILFGLMKLTWRDWLKYEKYFLDAKDDPAKMSELLQSKNKQAFFLTFTKFRAQASVIDPAYGQIKFCRYMMKAQRDFIIDFVDLNERSWAALAILTFINSLRGVVMSALNLQHTLTSALVYIVLIGCLPLVLLGALYIKCRKGFRQLTCLDRGEDADDEAPVLAVPLLKPADTVALASFEINHQYYFWRQDPLFTLQLMQIVMLCMFFYAAVIIISMGREMKQLYSIALVSASFVPPIIFMLLCPPLLQMVTIIASTGNLLDTELLHKIKQKDQKDSGLHKKKSIKNLLDVDAATRIRNRIAKTFTAPHLPFHFHGEKTDPQSPTQTDPTDNNSDDDDDHGEVVEMQPPSDKWRSEETL
eukprot:TRINITY_DN12780_c0_g1_i1.p2 TRINITY_DN12780_c0_g1~~TRINITY_DN12780_c0_g1_i1.p2  ORF type:complete len:490 (-),score=123.62 TRINITY_DN12780_c0_g1_i1:147-1616(-)